MKESFSFEHEGVAVLNPTAEARGQVSPEEYGFVAVLTGQGSAWQRPVEGGVIYLHRDDRHDLGPYGTEFTLEFVPRKGPIERHTLKVGIIPHTENDGPAPVCLGFVDWNEDGVWTAGVNLGDDFVLYLEIDTVKHGGWLTVKLVEYAQLRASTSMPLSAKRVQEILAQHAEDKDA